MEKTTALQSNLNKVEQANVDLRNELNKINQLAQSFKNTVTLPNMLNGSWDATFNDGGKISSERWRISGEDIYGPNDQTMKIRTFLYNPSINMLYFTLTDELKTPAGNGISYITEKARKSYLMTYIYQEGLYIDAPNGFSLKKVQE